MRPLGAAPSGSPACQAPDGSGVGGFGLTALAAGGLHPADVRVGDGPSAQARAQADWAASGAGPRGTDLARSLLAAHAAGIDPALITAERNFVAETLALLDGRRLYDPGASSSLSDDIFGTLGLAAVGRAAAGARRARGVPALAADRHRRLELHRGRDGRLARHDRRRRRRAVRGGRAGDATPRWSRRSRSCASARTR